MQMGLGVTTSLRLDVIYCYHSLFRNSINIRLFPSSSRTFPTFYHIFSNWVLVYTRLAQPFQVWDNFPKMGRVWDVSVWIGYTTVAHPITVYRDTNFQTTVENSLSWIKAIWSLELSLPLILLWPCYRGSWKAVVNVTVLHWSPIRLPVVIWIDLLHYGSPFSR